MLSISRIFPAYTATQATLVPSSDQFSTTFRVVSSTISTYSVSRYGLLLISSAIHFFNSLTFICEAKLRAFFKVAYM